MGKLVSNIGSNCNVPLDLEKNGDGKTIVLVLGLNESYSAGWELCLGAIYISLPSPSSQRDSWVKIKHLSWPFQERKKSKC